MNRRAGILVAVLLGVTTSLMAAEPIERQDEFVIRGGLEVGDLDKVEFLAGTRRSADTSAGISALSFHAARVVVEGGVRPYAGNDQLVAKINELADGRITPEVLALIRSSWTEAAGVAFVFYPKFLFISVRGTVYCDGSQGTDISECKVLQHADAYDMGILTND